MSCVYCDPKSRMATKSAMFSRAPSHSLLTVLCCQPPVASRPPPRSARPFPHLEHGLLIREKSMDPALPLRRMAAQLEEEPVAGQRLVQLGDGTDADVLEGLLESLEDIGHQVQHRPLVHHQSRNS